MTTSTAARQTSARPDERAGDERLVHLCEKDVCDGLADVRWLLHQALLGGARRIVVDLTEVPHLASPALASFLWAHRICRARGGAVVLRGADRRTQDVLRRTGLQHVLHVEPRRSRVAA
ncbi:STAS domain-containing protein [Modestobacter sp. SYSU DS0875]